MRRRTLTICAALLVICIAASSLQAAMNALTPAEKAAGWKLLFDGKILDGWEITGSPEGWAVEDGTIADLVKGGHYIATEQTYGNFKFACEFKMDKGTNSGIFFRWANLGDPVQTGIEMQILDTYGVNPPGRNDCGAIYDCLAPRIQACKRAGEWNKVVLTCKDNLIWIDMNGRRVLYMDLDKWTTPHQNPDGSHNKYNTAYKDMPRVGHIGFQDHGRKVWFRNIKIKLL